jgi:hypothetical protein
MLNLFFLKGANLFFFKQKRQVVSAEPQMQMSEPTAPDAETDLMSSLKSFYQTILPTRLCI